MRVWVSQDAAARAVGADRIADAIAAEAARRGVPLTLTRTGSRGMVWLEPLVELEVGGIRHAFGPVSPKDVPGLFDGGSPRALGPTDDLPWMRGQVRMTFARVGLTDPLSLADYAAHGGWAGLAAARAMDPGAVVQAVKDSGLRGRGGAGFPTGIKWETVRSAPGGRKYIVCNADEGDSGTFADRMLMEGDPFCLIEGMAIAAHAVGADKGYVYIRSEYPDAIRVMEAAVALSRDVVAPFDIEVRVGAGAYVCGEETSLLNSLEGRRGVVRAKPPLPALEGLFGRPTVVNNVLSLAAVPAILAQGPAAHAAQGVGRSRGTIPLQIAGNVRRGGLYEAPFGLTLGQIVWDIAGGTATGRPVKAVQVGGPLGAWFPPALFDTVIDYEAFAAAGGLVGHAGIVVVDDSADMLAMARFAMEFCAVESCGKCTPCRIGAVRGIEVIDRIAAGDAAALPLLADLCAVMKAGSLCALGGFTPYPVMSAVTHFPGDFVPMRRAAE
ncbi:MAG: NADH-ubiquinone oxidoreductase-F iron-sulfur binding region domain-containing protein [Gemmobacter sp.]